MLGLLLLAGLASAEPYLWTRAQLGVGAFPLGLIGDVRSQVRAPLWSGSDSELLADSYAGAGLRVAASPAFVTAGPRLSLAPAAFFDLDLQASASQYLDTGVGLLPFDETAHKLESERDARPEPDRATRSSAAFELATSPASGDGRRGGAPGRGASTRRTELRTQRSGESFGATAFSASASPTLKAKVGPVIAFDSVMVEAWHVQRPDGVDSPYVYEPLRDMVIGWDDIVIEHQPAVLLALWPGEDDRRLLWVGATMRDRFALQSGDRSMAVGSMVRLRPGGDSPAIPNVVLFVLPYVIDADRVGDAPNVQAALVWSGERGLTKGAAPR